MGTDYTTKHFSKPFLIRKIVWKIVNFCFAIRSDNNCIRSPDLSLGMTKWRMILEVKWAEGTDGCISLCLERLSDTGPDIVWVNWETALTAGTKPYAAIEHSFYFDCSTKKEVSLQSITSVLGNLPPFEDDALKIECNLILRRGDGSIKLDKPVDSGLRALSDDLKLLFGQKKHQDVTLKIGDKEIRAHKVVLGRNKVLKCLIEKAKNDVIELQNIDYESVSNLVSYIYSGDMEIIMKNPSIPMQKCIEFFDCEDLKCYYVPEQLNIHTKFEVEDYEFRWTVSEKVNASKGCVSSPLLRGINSNTTWKLSLGTNTENNCGYTYISISAEIVEGNKPQYFCLEFSLVDCYGQYYYPNRILRYNQSYSDMCFKEFVNISDLESSTLVEDDTFGIAFKVRTSNGSQKSSMRTRVVTFIMCPKDMSYKKLSSEMQGLLTEGKYSDVTLHSGNEAFRAHKCILSARSLKFSQLIQDTSKCNDNVIALSNIKPNALRTLLDYVYSGVLKDLELDDLLQLYEASNSFAIPCLKEECSKGLLTKVTNDNVTTVINIAKKLGDESLFKAIRRQVTVFSQLPELYKLV